MRVIAPGYISLIIWACLLNGAADNDFASGELSFQQNSQLTTNDAIGVIDAFGIFGNLVTSGLSQPLFNKVTGPLYIPVGVGQTIYLNTNASGATPTWKLLVHVIEGR